jgi:hypothetical protein
MTDNLDLWHKVARVPAEHLKGFTRGGGFKGTAVKPMWSIQTMTEQFGPIGNGWGTSKPEYQVIPAGNELLVFCTLEVWAVSRENTFYGVGGDKVVAQFSSGLKADDEAFKKAFTDALTNALKHIGVAADIHMGLWDGNKYVDEQPEPKPAIGLLPATHNDTKGNTRDAMQQLCREIESITRVFDLDAWGKRKAAEISALNDDLKETVRNSYTDKMKELKEGLAA